MTPGPAQAALVAAVAVVALVGLPALVGQQASQPAEGNLTVQLTGEQGAGEPYEIALDGHGEPPRRTTLRDASGQYTGQVTSVPLGRCRPDTTRVAFPDGNRRWCLRLTKVDAGHDLTGTVGGPEGKLELTVQRRAAFLPYPLLVLIGGLALGILAAWAPQRLRTSVRRIVLERLVKGNAKGTKGDTPIEGLAAWVEARRKHGEDPDTLIPAVHWAIEHGPAVAGLARTNLAAALDETGAGDEPPPRLHDRGREIANGQGVEIGDLYAEDGSRLAEHPADLLTEAVRRAVAIQAEIDGRGRQLTGLQSNSDVEEARVALKAAQVQYRELGEPSEVGRMDTVLDSLGRAVARARATAQPSGAALVGAAAEQAVMAAPRGAIAQGTVARQGVGALKPRTALALAVTGAIGLAALVYAGLTIWNEIYDPRPTFDAFGDYLALFSAALGSGAAGTVLGLLGYWQVTDSSGQD
jgi:hypothetical protein